MVRLSVSQSKIETAMTTLAKKLQLKTGQSLMLVNPPAGTENYFATEEIDITEKSDAVLIFTNSLVEVEKIVLPAFESVFEDSLVWVAYPKGSSGVKTDVNRDKLWDALKRTGWRPVRQIALDDIWSALRFRPAEKVGK
jgi:hypothetical protein